MHRRLLPVGEVLGAMLAGVVHHVVDVVGAVVAGAAVERCPTVDRHRCGWWGVGDAIGVVAATVAAKDVLEIQPVAHFVDQCDANRWRANRGEFVAGQVGVEGQQRLAEDGAVVIGVVGVLAEQS